MTTTTSSIHDAPSAQAIASEPAPPLISIHYDEADLRIWEESLWNEGCLVIRNALDRESVDYLLGRLREGEFVPDGKQRSTAPFLPLLDEAFLRLTTHEPVYSLARRILGSDMHLWLYAAHIMRRDQTISAWHPDDLYQVRPPHVSDEVPFPPVINVLNCHYYLVDVPQELGPTEVVPGSHSACRLYDPKKDGEPPTWNGQGPISFTVKAGDCVVYSNHCWHRGAPITSDGTRYSVVPYYGRRFIQQRMREGDRGVMPEEILARCTPEQRELLGYHEAPAHSNNRKARNMRWSDRRPVV